MGNMSLAVDDKGENDRVLLLFFFQAEDGIRDYKVTGVQTCALPISAASRAEPTREVERVPAAARLRLQIALIRVGDVSSRRPAHRHASSNRDEREIGRASCRERV